MGRNRINSNPVLAIIFAILGLALGCAIYYFALQVGWVFLFFFTAPVFLSCYFYARFAKPNFLSTLFCLGLSYFAMRWMVIALDPFQSLAKSMGYNSSLLALLLEPIVRPSPLFIGHYVNTFFLILIAFISLVYYRKKFWDTKSTNAEAHSSFLQAEEAGVSAESYAMLDNYSTSELFSSSASSSSPLFGADTITRKKKGRQKKAKGNAGEESLF